VRAGEFELKERNGGARQTLSPDAALKRIVGLIESQRVLV
jgi:hypothetical protein